MRLIETNPILGGVERLWTNDDGDILDEVIADVEPVIDMNKRFQCNDRPLDGLHTGAGSFELIARIPLVIAEQWKRVYGVDVMDKTHWPRVQALLNNPDWRYMKTVEGSV